MSDPRRTAGTPECSDLQIFDPEVDVHYGFICVLSVPGAGSTPRREDDELVADHSTAIKDQTNGSAGAGLPHSVTLVTGLYTGEVL
jgi:hypothetical protein